MRCPKCSGRWPLSAELTPALLRSSFRCPDCGHATRRPTYYRATWLAAYCAATVLTPMSTQVALWLALAGVWTVIHHWPDPKRPDVEAAPYRSSADSASRDGLEGGA
jgi:hypothetical protein